MILPHPSCGPNCFVLATPLPFSLISQFSSLLSPAKHTVLCLIYPLPPGCLSPAALLRVMSQQVPGCSLPSSSSSKPRQPSPSYRPALLLSWEVSGAGDISLAQQQESLGQGEGSEGLCSSKQLEQASCSLLLNWVTKPQVPSRERSQAGVKHTRRWLHFSTGQSAGGMRCSCSCPRQPEGTAYIDEGHAEPRHGAGRRPLESVLPTQPKHGVSSFALVPDCSPTGQKCWVFSPPTSRKT